MAADSVNDLKIQKEENEDKIEENKQKKEEITAEKKSNYFWSRRYHNTNRRLWKSN